jgi:hypothetical protein
MTTLYDLIDKWTIEPWNQGFIDQVLYQVAAPFYDRRLIFFLLEEIWDLIEIIEDPLEFMTDAVKIKHMETLLDDDLIVRAAKAIKVNVDESSEFTITVLNADEVIEEHPDWFEKDESMTLDEVVENLRRAVDEKKE